MTTPENAAGYLERVGWKGLLELLTAEVVLHRPENAALFVKLTLDRLLAASDGAVGPSDVNDWLKRCYADASARVDESGVIYDLPLQNH